MPKCFLYLARQLKQFSCWFVAIIAQMIIYVQGRERGAPKTDMQGREKEAHLKQRERKRREAERVENMCERNN